MFLPGQESFIVLLGNSQAMNHLRVASGQNYPVRDDAIREALNVARQAGTTAYIGHVDMKVTHRGNFTMLQPCGAGTARVVESILHEVEGPIAVLERRERRFDHNIPDNTRSGGVRKSHHHVLIATTEEVFAYADPQNRGVLQLGLRRNPR